MRESYEEKIISLVETYYEDIFYFLYHFIGNRNDAEDIAQEVFVRILQALPRYDGRVHIKTWIYSIAKHAAIDLYRRQKFQRFFSDLWFRSLPAKDGLPEDIFVEKERDKELKQVILLLPPKYRLVIILRALEGCSVKETAELLGISESKVKVDYHRAIKLIQKKLSDRSAEEGGGHHVLGR
ncbi:ECF RNA polymerase sigma factor SigW [Brevibacillus reuszeri]|uniref:RNA polymerase sigma factor n=1 Tax=Brevibacillus reuszeri TaxID=54915 RepID=UPI001B1279EF|nr:sigma-70 family RNA polymerase sigma factor [Brevibacillus reuszeri]GIO07114.1 ECF RNA polymerase sigma factor SigW [Brevibacillus reuszeri]